MAKARLYPHQVADLDSITFGDWWIERNGGRTPIQDSLAGWDYASEELVGTSLSIDEDRLLGSTGLRSLDDLELLLMADCSAAQRRVVARHALSGRGALRDAAFELRLPAGELAVSIRLTSQVVLARDLIGTDRRVASVRGARIASSKAQTLNLEGEASRFPTDPVAFSEMGLPTAPWTLHLSFEDLNTSFMGGVRLLVNTEHHVGRMLLDNTAASRVSGLAMADILRLLIASAADYSGRAEEVEFEEGSVGQVIESMCTFFLRQGLTATLELYQRDPIHFDRVLHDRIKPFDRAFE